MNIKKIKPLFTAVVVTANVYPRDYKEHSIISPKANKLKEYQKVVAVGDSCRGIEEGDLVCIDATRFAVRKHREGSLKDGVITDNPVTSYNFDVVELDDKPCLLLQDRDIEFIIEDFEEVPDSPPSNIFNPKKEIVV